MPRWNRVTGRRDVVSAGDDVESTGVEDLGSRSACAAAAPTAPSPLGLGLVCARGTPPGKGDSANTGTKDPAGSADRIGGSAPNPGADT